MDQALSRGHIGGYGDVVHVAQAKQVCVIRLIRLGIERIAEKQQQVDLIIGNARGDLLVAAQSAAEKCLDFKPRCVRDELAGGTGSAQGVSGKGAAVGNAELNHQFLFGIVRDQCYIHELSSFTVNSP